MKKSILTLFLTLAVFCAFATGCGTMNRGGLTAPRESISQQQPVAPQGEKSAYETTTTPVHSINATVDTAQSDDVASSAASNAMQQNDRIMTAPLPEIDKNITAVLTITGMNPDSFDDVIHLFNSKFPNVTVEKDAIQLTDPNVGNAAAELHTKLNTKILSGQAGDIILFSNSISLFKQGVLADLHEFIYNDLQFTTDDYFMNVIEAYSYNGKLYVMPLNNYVKMIGFSASLTDDYSFTDKSDSWELMQAISEGKNIADRNGLKGKNYVYPTPDYHLLSRMMLPINYNKFVNLETGKVNIDSAEFIDMLKYVKELADSGYISSSERTYNLPEGAPILSPFDTGLMLFYFMTNEPDCINFKPLTGKNGLLNISGSTPLAINAQSANKQLAWEFIKCALSFEAQSSPNRRIYPPINRTALNVYAEQRYSTMKDSQLNNGINKETDFKPDKVEVIRQYIEHFFALNEMVTTYTFTDFDIDGIIFEQVIEYFEGKISAEETAQILQRKISMVIEG